MAVKVIHIRDADFNNPTHVYIGRGSSRRPGNPLANPEKLKDEKSRVSNIGRYRRWLWEHLFPGSRQLVEIQRLHRLHDAHGELNLVCFCAPKVCHGDVVKSVLEFGGYHPDNEN